MSDIDGYGPATSAGRGALWVRIGLAVVVVGAGVGVYLATRSGNSSQPNAAGSPSPTASAADGSSASPTATPTASGAASPSPSSGVTSSPHATVSASAHPSASPTRPSVSAGYPPPGLVMTVRDRPISGNPPGVGFSIHVTDNDGTIRSLTVDYGDGTSVTVVHEAQPPCSAPPPRSPRPGYHAAPLDKTYDQSHRYQHGGRFQAVIKVVTARQCEGAPVESDTKSFTVTVPNFTPNPSDSPTPSPAPTPSPS